jgi:hypothetical protein
MIGGAPSGRCFFVRAKTRFDTVRAAKLLRLRTGFSGFPLDRKGLPPSQLKYRSTARRITVDPPKAPISVGLLTGSFPLITVQTETAAEQLCSPYKDLYVLTKFAVGGFGALASGQ